MFALIFLFWKQTYFIFQFRFLVCNCFIQCSMVNFVGNVETGHRCDDRNGENNSQNGRCLPSWRRSWWNHHFFQTEIKLNYDLNVNWWFWLENVVFARNKFPQIQIILINAKGALKKTPFINFLNATFKVSFGFVLHCFTVFGWGDFNPTNGKGGICRSS